MSIFGPGIANGLIAGGPQLGAGAAVGTGLAVAGIGAVGVGLAGAGVGAISTAGGLAAGAARGGASLAGAATTAYRGGGMSGMAEAAASSAGSAAMSPLRRAAASLRESFAAGGRAGKDFKHSTAWVLQRARPLREPVPYHHPAGAVIWVNLDPEVAEMVEKQLAVG